MPSNILRHEKIGSTLIIKIVLERLQQGAAAMDDIREHAASREHGAYEAMLGCLSLLLDLGYIKEVKGRYSSVQGFHGHRFLEDFTKMLNDEGILRKLFNQKAVVRDGGRIYINNKGIPLECSQIRNFFFDSKIILKEEEYLYRYYVSDSYVDLFLSKVLPFVDKGLRHRITLKELEKSLEDKAERGKEAEKFVLKYEQEARQKHPGWENIRIISEEDVGAGYDIQSYQSDASTELDKFIEVKSYFSSRRFYWSRNELERAEELGSQYCLYIVDSSRIGEQGYEPEIIENPCKRLEGWTETCETLRYDPEPRGPEKAE
ncbi:MAG: DUF3883 domain-containing protein [Betaproteobacteria bacterium AqS2]|uniref:DUF3883 domain-containing protein n=1 Tax=Candidatus Amphirhobacter heronislandensis TaxID=1732024 RepID=A0A930UHA4_9GAMM|nr:DUF3883 domain-containing protein [Betaproteobacteria bacterium AqS2]